MADAANFLDPTTLTTVGGCATAVLLIGNAIQRAFQFNPTWFVLLLSLIVSLVASFLTPVEYVRTSQWLTHGLFVAVNGAVIFLAAVGGNTIATPTPSPPPQPTGGDMGGRAAPRRAFWTRW